MTEDEFETNETDERAEDATDDPRIVALDDDTVRRIAAGEVVERPASVVKELLENSLDADASRVSVAVEAGGTEGIRVRDDGVGISAAELDLAVREHHTSKIGDIDDLEAGVASLGFRGEALYAVGAVSRLTVRSKPRGGVPASDASGGSSGRRSDGDVGHELTVEGGDVGEVRPAGCPEGTTVEVENLFFNVPARKKFLKTVATEFDHVNTVVTQYALANPDVAVSLDHDGREVFATEGNGDLRSAVLSVYGREVAEAMVDVEWVAGDGGEGDGGGGVAGTDGGSADRGAAAGDATDSPVRAVRGLVSHPETTRAGREYLSTFVNGRYVTAATLREAVLDAYGGQLATDRYPFAVLFVDVDPATIDVNVHPRKLEVRFDDEPGVRAAVEDAVEEALLAHGLVRSSAPRGRSKADEATITPGEDADEVVGGAGTRHEEASGVQERRSERLGAREKRSELGGARDDRATGADASPAEASAGENDDRSAEPVGAADESTDVPDDTADAPDDTTDSPDYTIAALDESPAATDDPPAAADEEPPTVDEADWAVDLSGDGSVGDADHGSTRERPSPRGWQTDPSEGGSGDATGSAGGEPDPATRSPAARPSSDAARPFTAPTTQRTLAGEAADAGGEFDSLPSMRVLGQLHETYVVAETDRGLVLVDQHAADERVNYERLRREFAGGVAAQALADPVVLELTAREAELFTRYDEAMADLGFEAERTGERSVAVRSVPAVFDAALDPELLRDVLTAFVADEGEGGRAAVDDVADDLLADLACYPSVTGNTSLTEGSVTELLAALDDCENPYACPHGRPVVIELSEDEIRDRFERDYPGHGGRRREE